ncbi:deoxynucleotide monophosphate kinase family protein [Streptomyces erythrochromogenes]|uniref:deoxynucleotide monophosphate kinase family protein n=1 Tax=Streptomyces erythrochromogenes TaxID=285574 RepID=UPI0037FC8BD6
MSFRHVALMGRARSGKDTAAARLVQRHQFVRVAFADPLRESAMALDPIVGADASPYGALPIRLSDLVKRYGWERAKTEYPEVRRTLQRLGEAVREHDRDYWLRLALDKIRTADRWGLPVVVTDCRYPNEAAALRAAGALLVRVDRPSLAEHQDQGAEHISETALAGYRPDAVLTNTGTVAELHQAVDRLAVPR